MPVIPENIINLSTNTVPETVIEIDIDDVGRVFVIEAKAQAERAQEYAETSASYVSRAEIAAGRAEASETSATASATSASASATSATASATTASTDADRAETAATSATSDADRAEAARDAAEDLIPGEGLVGDFLQKTVDGAQWATIPGGGAIWGGITGTLDNQTDLKNRLDTKITAPATGSTGQLLSKTANGTEWVDAPNSAVWGLIQGDLSDQTDVYNAINAKGSVDTVNGISPNAQKNVQVDVELTQAQYDALPATKLTNNVNYFIKDGAYRPQGSVIDSAGVMYDNTESGLNSDTVQGAIDENASAIEELNNGLSTLLWTNPNPSASFSPQTIPMDLTNYKFLLIGYRYAKEASVQSAQIIIKGIDSVITSPHMAATGGNFFRYIKSSDTAIEIGRGVKGGSGDDSGVNVPTYIYGIK